MQALFIGPWAFVRKRDADPLLPFPTWFDHPARMVLTEGLNFGSRRQNGRPFGRLYRRWSFAG